MQEDHPWWTCHKKQADHGNQACFHPVRPDAFVLMQEIGQVALPNMYLYSSAILIQLSRLSTTQISAIQISAIQIHVSICSGKDRWWQSTKLLREKPEKNAVTGVHNGKQPPPFCRKASPMRSAPTPAAYMQIQLINEQDTHRNTQLSTNYLLCYTIRRCHWLGVMTLYT